MTPIDTEPQTDLTAHVARVEARDRKWAKLGTTLMLAALRADPAALPPDVRAAAEAFRAAASNEGGQLG
ncbi:MAG: hypothetical protein JWO31_4009 [Phycisphaerales bacterium]|nr:hypothetical protein [Phycisphaerales bacterium]